MNKSTPKKKLWSILAIVGVLGIVLMVTGLAMGAQTELYLDQEGIRISDSQQRQQISELDLGEMTGLDIKISSGRLEIIPGAQNGFEVDCQKNVPISWSHENGTLSIRRDFGFLWNVFGFNIFNFKEDVIKIYVSEATLLESAHLECTSGKINVKDLDSQNLSLKIISGSMNLEHVSADDLSLHCTSGDVTMSACRTKGMNMSISSGWVKASEIESGGMSARVTSGSMKLAGAFNGENKLEVGSGSVTMEAAGSKEEYSRTISVTSGSVTVNGSKALGNDTNPAAPHTLWVKVTSGSVKIQFLED